MLEEGARDPSKQPYCPSALNDSQCCFLNKIDDSKLFCCRCAQKRTSSPLTCLAICFLVLTYNLLGGFLFLALEGNNSVESVAASTPNLSQSQGSNDLRSKTVERLWSITEDLNILYKENWTKLAAKELMDFQQVLMKTMKGSVLKSRLAVPHEPDYRWTFSSSFLYALTLITTIGHGGMSPRSAAGRLAAAGYAGVGIPLVMLYLATTGAALAAAVRAGYARLRPAGRPPEREPRDKAADAPPRTPFQAALNLAPLGARRACRRHPRVPGAVSVAFIVAYVALGALVFRHTEQWSLADGCYFSVSSLATIGFGELRPGRHAGGASPAAADLAIAVCCAYILVGVAVVAMCVELLREPAAAAAAALPGRPRAVHSACRRPPAS